MNAKKFNLKQIVFLFFVIGLLVSCSKHNPKSDPNSLNNNPVIKQLTKVLNENNFDTHPDLRVFVTHSSDSSRIWIDEELKNGRTTSRNLNEVTGEYTCKSVPKDILGGVEEKLLKLLDENGGDILLDDEE